MQEETQDAQQRLAEMNAELLEAQGLDQKAELLRQQLDYQQQLAAIERQRQEAELTGNRDLLAVLNEQKRVLEDINAAKTASIAADETNNARNNASNNASNAGSNARSASTSTVTVNINASGQLLDNAFANSLARQLKPHLDAIAQRSL